MNKNINHEIHEISEIYEQKNKNKNQRNDGMGEKILYKEECYAIQGAIFEVYKTMGCGFLEAVYQECLTIEFRSLPQSHYRKGHPLNFRVFCIFSVFRGHFLFAKILPILN